MLCRGISHQVLAKSTARYCRRIFRNYVDIRHKIDNDLLLSTMEYSEITSISDWKNVREAVLEHEFNRGKYTRDNIDALILSYCTNAKKYDLGLSYIDFLNKENKKPNLATVGRYLKLLYMKNHEQCLESGKACPGDQEELILKQYENVRKEYPILDSFTLENSVLALSVTTEWKKCLDLLREIRISAVPNSSAYSALVTAAFLNKDEVLAWELLREMMECNRVPRDITYLSYVKSIGRLRKREKAVEKLEKLFTFFQENDVVCQQRVALGIDDLSGKFGLRNNFTTVSGRGICKCCNVKLQSFELSDEDFSELKSEIFNNVIVGKDIFVKTNPEELERFKEFIAKMGKFDVVLDGLNVAYSAGTKQPPAVFSAMVASVVRHFVEHDLKVLVLGRRHMNRWPRDSWGYVAEHARLFLTQNISQDDPYLLYCALSSGKDTIIVTRDLMRGHRFLLKTARHRILFNRWLTQRQYQLIRVDDRRGPSFRMPLPFSILAQQNRGTWHVPYEVDEKKDQSEFHKMWLCLKQ